MRTLVLTALTLLTGAIPEAQADLATQASEPQRPQTPATDDPALDLDRAEPDFEVVNVPTGLALPRGRLSFRVTHRFARPLGQGSFSDLAADLFGLDGGAQIGLGLRAGVFAGTQLGVYRTSDRTIQFDLRQSVLRQQNAPLGVTLVGSLEGLDNFGEEHAPALALVLSRKLGDRGAVYAVPAWVGNTRVASSAPPGEDDSTLVLGLGARVLLTRTLAVVGEWHPRLAGYAGNLGSGDADALATFGVEARVGGHAFQLSVSNGLGTTRAQVARGAQRPDGWFLGFNITRKFY